MLPDALVCDRRRYAGVASWSPARVAARFAGGPAPDVLAEPDWLLREHRAGGALPAAGPRSCQHLIGAVLACNGQLFADIGGFDDTFVGYGGEHSDFGYRAFNACAG